MIELLMYEPDRERAERMRSTIRSLFMYMKCNYKFTTYFTCHEAMKCVAKNVFQFDVVLIHLGDEEDARKIAGVLRSRNMKSMLIFIGGDYEKLCRLLPFRPSAFVSDTSDSKRVGNTIFALYKEYSKSSRGFLIQNRGELERIPYEHIDFFESSNRKVYLHTNQGAKVYEFNAKIDDVINAIPVSGFARCHQSFLVNLENVRRIDKIGKQFLTFSGKTVDISKRNLSDMAEYFQQYVNINC